MSKVKQELFSKEFLDKWFINYDKFKSFTKQPDAIAPVADQELAHWVEVQRSIKHMLPKKLIDKLKEIDFDFEFRNTTWDTMYRQLAKFIQVNGPSYPSAHQGQEALKDWLIRQIQNKRFLSQDQIQRLDSLCIDWNLPLSRDGKWEQMFLRLKDFQLTFGHCRVPQRWVNDKQLANWIAVNRRMYAQNKLRIDRQQRLSELGFVWSIKTQYDAQWEAYFKELVAFHHRYGHCRVPGKYDKLVSWIERQRVAQTKNQLSTEQERKLNDLGFIWSFKNIKESIWEQRYRQLQEYKQENGHCFVPVNFPQNKGLGTWVATQRRIEAKNKLGVDHKKKLSEIGFVWSTDTKGVLKCNYDLRWQTNLEKLRAYKNLYGTCQVSLKIDPALQRWTRWQRIRFYEGKLTKERIHKLNHIQFPWSIEEGYWLKMYDALTLFKKGFGHTRVPHNWEPNPQLAAWVYRVKLAKAELTAQKTELLKAIDFDWTLHSKVVLPWKVMYDRLIEFKHIHGHTCVPVKWHKDPKLGKWVSRMRHEREKLALERIFLLDAIGFAWSPQTSYILTH